MSVLPEPGERTCGPVFIVEDDTLVAMGIRSMTERLGHGPIHVFPNAEEALAKLETVRPRLVLMDIMLGSGMDGLTAVREVMSRHPCPVIITTAFTEGTYIEEAMKAQVFGFMVKPITQRQLASAVALAQDRFERFQRETAERCRAEEAVEAERRRLLSLMEALPAFVCLIATEYEIRYANRRFLDLFGEPGARPCYEVLYGRAAPCERCDIARVLRERRPSEYEWPFDDGRVFHVYDYPFTDVDGAPLVLRLGIDVTERNRLEREILDVAQAEQQRIGQDLHDTLGQHLTGISFLAKALEQKLSATSPAEAADAATISRMTNDAVRQARALARGLSPIKLKAGGLSKAFQELAADVETIFGVACRSEVDEEIAVADESAATHLYRIAQEAVTNAVKHGRASRILLRLARCDGAIRLTVEDNGVGLPETLGEVEGMGLRIMGYRARMIGGELDIRRADGGGTRVECSVPGRAQPRGHQ